MSRDKKGRRISYSDSGGREGGRGRGKRLLMTTRRTYFEKKCGKREESEMMIVFNGVGEKHPHLQSSSSRTFPSARDCLAAAAV